MDELSVDLIKHFEQRGLQSIGKRVDLPDGRQLIIKPIEMDYIDVKPLDPILTRIKQRVEFPHLGSFCKYVESFKEPDTLIFADISTSSVVCIFDYHESGNKDPKSTNPSVPNHCRHFAIFKPKFSLEWERWTKFANTEHSQVDFAEFLEENAIDIIDPESAEILEICSNLDLTKTTEFKSAENLQDGAKQLVFKEKITGRGDKQFVVPEKIKLGIPVYFEGDAYPVEVFLRYRVREETKLKFKIVLHREEYVKLQAFGDMLFHDDNSIKARTGIDVLMGMVSEPIRS